MKRCTSFILLLSAVLLLSGCRTYFGYETHEEKHSFDSGHKVSSKVVDYNIEVVENRIKIEVEQEDVYEKEIVICEIRDHVYLSNVEHLCLPIRWPFDLLFCWGNWNLCSNPPGFTQRLFYTPPFCWFAVFSCPPYWLDDPKSLPEGKSNYRTYRDSSGRTENISIVKNIEQEKVNEHTEKEKYTVKSSHYITDSAPDGEKIYVSIAGKNFELSTEKPVITREMLPTFISDSKAITATMSVKDKGTEEKLAKFNFKEKIPLAVRYKNKEQECFIDTFIFMTGEELWNCGLYYFAKKDVSNYATYLRRAAEEGYPPAMCLIGGSYLKGDKIAGIAQNVELGIWYVKKSADAGYPEAGLRLAELYLASKDIREKLPTGTDIRQLLKKCESDEQRAVVGLLLATEAMNNSDARKYCEAALEKNNENAEALYMMSRLMFEDNRKQEGLKYLKMAAEKNHAEAQCKLAEMCFGEQTLSKIKEACKWMEKAAEQKNKAAMKMLPKYRERLKTEEDFEYYSTHQDSVVAKVKHSVFNLDSSMTLEDALSDQLSALRWRKTKNERNQEVVEAVGVWNNNRFDGKPSLPQQDERVMVQFAVAPSGRVRCCYGELRRPDNEMKYFMIVPAHTDPRGYLDVNKFLMLLYGMGTSEFSFYKDDFSKKLLEFRMGI